MKYHITLPDEVAEKLEKERGDVPRSTFIRRAVERALYAGTTQVKKKG